MFASSQIHMAKNNGKQFHRHVRPITSLFQLETIINLMKIDSVLIGEIDHDTTDFHVTKAEPSQTIAALVQAIYKNQPERQVLHEKVKAELNGQNLFATVFITDEPSQKSSTLVLAVGCNKKMNTYVSVAEQMLMTATQIIWEG